jgi:hypothetical protein
VTVWGEVVGDDVELLAEPPGAQSLEEVEELDVAFAAPDPVVDLPGGQVECGEHVHDAVPAVVGRP